jgi:hypothetical protein
VIARDIGVTTSDRVTDLVCVGELASATAAVKVAVPLAVGVPEIRCKAQCLRLPGVRLNNLNRSFPKAGRSN